MLGRGEAAVKKKTVLKSHVLTLQRFGRAYRGAMEPRLEESGRKLLGYFIQAKMESITGMK